MSTMEKSDDNKQKMPIREWNEEDRPRERFMRFGPASLTSAELLAILIGSGNARELSADERANQLELAQAAVRAYCDDAGS